MNLRLFKPARVKALLIVVSLFTSASPAPPGARVGPRTDVTAIVGATVIDGTGRAPFRATVVLRGERVEAVAPPEAAVPAGARVVRAEGQTLLPGLFDLHTHQPYATAPGVVGDWPKNLKAYLFCGVTTVVDFGTYPETFAPVRELVREGAFEAPRVHFAARLTTPGGHGAEGGRGDLFTLEVQTPREARLAVRRLLPYRPDAVKVFTDGWRYGAAPDMTSMNEETLTALVDEAHRHDLPVLTHTVTLERAKQAARAGVDVIAHGVGDREVDAELGALMKAKGTAYVSTLAVYEPRGRDILTPLLEAVLEPAVRAAFRPPLTPPAPGEENLVARQTLDLPTNPSAQAPGPAPTPTPADARAEQAARQRAARARRWQNLLRNVALLRQAGVALGAGTDAGVTGTHHGWATLREVQLLAAGGLTPLEAITAATGASAKALRVEAERGTIAPGKLADLLLVEGAPHERLSDLTRVSRVFLGGREIDRARLAREIAAPDVTPLPAVRPGERIDDFEAAPAAAPPREGEAVRTHADTLRSALGTLWTNSTDSEVNPTRMVFGRVARDGRGRALLVTARMSMSENPFARVSVPVSPGAVRPADVRGWRGVRFDVRGEGDYRLILPTRAARDGRFHRAPFRADARWRTVRVDFTSLTQPTPPAPAGAAAAATSVWTGTDLLMLTFEIARPPGEVGWLELDDIRFYK